MKRRKIRTRRFLARFRRKQSRNRRDDQNQGKILKKTEFQSSSVIIWRSLIIEKFKIEEVLVDIEYFGEGIFDIDLDVDDFTKNVTDEFSRVRKCFILYVS